MTKQLLEEL
jgi:ribosomal RNA-processing protein 9